MELVILTAMLTLLRILKTALQDLGRNLSLSFMTVFILVLMLLSINTLWIIEVLTKQAVETVRRQIDVSVYFIPEAEEKDVNEVKIFLAMFPEVTSVEVQTKEDVLNLFKEKHFDNKDVLEALQELGGNPFGPTMIIKTEEPKDYRKVMESLNVPEYDRLIESKSFDDHEEAIDKLQSITSRIERFVFGLAILFVVIAFLIIFNTIRVAIATQRVEISIKRLVGASNWYIRGPYLIESLIFTVFSMAGAIVVVFGALKWVDPYVSVVFSRGFSLTNYYKSNILWLFGAQALAVLLLTIISSVMAMRKQLRV
ncbi:MAG: Efflux ABC transporter, permease protein, FtsX family [Candidatus Magasanikbacteria bacterium GW2011_GWA2_46_17]|uniref:Cell division protein FtsX n=1 Tax=Candidatus Magasanikbacteria bacterium GW2011_GWA2_46_17 TaxID=1619042 RepID=A0A0G1P050_9BACT|nr:MAG: Efflux ABC transporter, permease protein, FtsX family [Candidatus Magasanikbacteria bacterium GW2011_GWA2_46_17]